MESTGSFWAFATELYQRDGVEGACLWLQDNGGVDVVVLLYCCWVARRGVSIADDNILIRSLDDARTWSEHLIKPLRESRRWYRQHSPGTEPDSLYRALKETELAAEKELIARLEALTEKEVLAEKYADPNCLPEESLRLARKNIQVYLGMASIALDHRSREAMDEILALC